MRFACDFLMKVAIEMRGHGEFNRLAPACGLVPAIIYLGTPTVPVATLR
jgi:hypothetical protein